MTGTGEVKIPIKQIQRLEITPKVIRVTDEEGGVTEADDITARLVYGPRQSISSGKGAELWLRRSDFKQSLLVTRVKE